jgi:hypothetical protein
VNVPSLKWKSSASAIHIQVSRLAIPSTCTIKPSFVLTFLNTVTNIQSLSRLLSLSNRTRSLSIYDTLSQIMPDQHQGLGTTQSSTSNATFIPWPTTTAMASVTGPQPTMSKSPAFLASCPAEILTMIASELSFEDLKSFRLVSKVFAAQSLFGQRPFILFETSQSLARLNDISNAPNLANALRLIKKFQLWTVRPFNASGEQQLDEGQGTH